MNGKNISIDQITSTLKASADSLATAQKQRYFQALKSIGHFKLNGNQLVITYDDGKGFLICETPFPAGPGSPIPAVETQGG